MGGGAYDYSVHGDNWVEGKDHVCQSPIRLGERQLVDCVSEVAEIMPSTELRPAVPAGCPKVKITFSKTGANVDCVDGEFYKANIFMLDGEELHLANIHFHRKAEHVFANSSAGSSTTASSPTASPNAGGSPTSPIGSPQAVNHNEVADDEDFFCREGLEVHCVFDDSSNTHRAVIGVVFKAGPSPNPFLSSFEWPVFNAQEEHPEGRTCDWKIEGQDFLSQLTGSVSPYRFIHYEGSLTTPPCTEGIKWFVTESHATIGQMSKFDHLLNCMDNKTGNFRHCQGLHNRKMTAIQIPKVAQTIVIGDGSASGSNHSAGKEQKKKKKHLFKWY